MKYLLTDHYKATKNMIEKYITWNVNDIIKLNKTN